MILPYNSVMLGRLMINGRLLNFHIRITFNRKVTIDIRVSILAFESAIPSLSVISSE